MKLSLTVTEDVSTSSWGVKPGTGGKHSPSL